MGIADFFSDILDSLPWAQDVHAEAPEDDEEGGKDDGDTEEDMKLEGHADSEEDAGVGDGAEETEEAQADEDEEEEEEEEEEEPEDPKPRLEEGEEHNPFCYRYHSIVRNRSDEFDFAECARSAQCIGYKHHYQECVERVTAQHEDESYKGPKEDCVEECKKIPTQFSAFVLTACQSSISSTAPLSVPLPDSSSCSSKSSYT